METWIWIGGGVILLVVIVYAIRLHRTHGSWSVAWTQAQSRTGGYGRAIMASLGGIILLLCFMQIWPFKDIVSSAPMFIICAIMLLVAGIYLVTGGAPWHKKVGKVFLWSAAALGVVSVIIWLGNSWRGPEQKMISDAALNHIEHAESIEQAQRYFVEFLCTDYEDEARLKWMSFAENDFYKLLKIKEEAEKLHTLHCGQAPPGTPVKNTPSQRQFPPDFSLLEDVYVLQKGDQFKVALDTTWSTAIQVTGLKGIKINHIPSGIKLDYRLNHRDDQTYLCKEGLGHLDKKPKFVQFRVSQCNKPILQGAVSVVVP